MDPEKKLFIGLGSAAVLFVVVLAILSVLAQPVRLIHFVDGIGLDRWAWDHLLTTNLKVKMLNQDFDVADEDGAFPRFGLGCGGELIPYSSEFVHFRGVESPVLTASYGAFVDGQPLETADGKTYSFTSAVYPIRLLIEPTIVETANGPVACLRIHAEPSRSGP